MDGMEKLKKEFIAERNANLEKIRELEKENRKIRDDLLVFEDELERIRKVAERLRDSDDENEISLEENIAGKYMIKVLDGENFS